MKKIDLKCCGNCATSKVGCLIFKYSSGLCPKWTFDKQTKQERLNRDNNG